VDGGIYRKWLDGKTEVGKYIYMGKWYKMPDISKINPKIVEDYYNKKLAFNLEQKNKNIALVHGKKMGKSGKRQPIEYYA
jgi:hypothetical protein